jgi:hypothetical protein
VEHRPGGAGRPSIGPAGGAAGSRSHWVAVPPENLRTGRVRGLLIERAPQHLHHVRAGWKRQLGHVRGEELEHRHERDRPLGLRGERGGRVKILAQWGHNCERCQNGPPSELSRAPGLPARGCSRTALRRKAATSGSTASTSTGRTGEVRAIGTYFSEPGRGLPQPRVTSGLARQSCTL